jgi:hypothetical protein
MGIKRASAKDGNVVLGRIGKPFWQDESFDRWVRNSREFERIRSYMEYNPVKAHLARRPEEWRCLAHGTNVQTPSLRKTAQAECLCYLA